MFELLPALTANQHVQAPARLTSWTGKTQAAAVRPDLSGSWDESQWAQKSVILSVSSHSALDFRCILYLSEKSQYLFYWIPCPVMPVGTSVCSAIKSMWYFPPEKIWKLRDCWSGSFWVCYCWTDLIKIDCNLFCCICEKWNTNLQVVE